MPEKFKALWSTLSSSWQYEIMMMDEHPITVGKVVLALVVVLVSAKLSRWISNAFVKRVLVRFGTAVGEAAAFQSLIFYVLLVAFTLFALHLVHFPLTVFTLAGGAVAIGVGFGSQNILNNFISGLILLLEGQIRVGDVVEVDGQQGRIQRIGARSTRILTGDSVEVIFPNSFLLERRVSNWTLSENKARFRVRVGAAYGTDSKNVIEILQKIAGENPHILKDPEPIAVFADFGDSSLVFDLYYWVPLRDPTNRLEIESDIRHRICKEFEKAGISIPFPQRDIHLIGQTVGGVKGAA